MRSFFWQDGRGQFKWMGGETVGVVLLMDPMFVGRYVPQGIGYRLLAVCV
jgi:hypothetical protein